MSTDSNRLDQIAVDFEKPLEPAVEDYELDEDFSYEGYQVVRGEFFAHIFEPSITFSDCKATVNQSCLGKLPNTTYVHILVNPGIKRLVIIPADESERDSILWCSRSDGKRKPKSVSCKMFFAKLAALMDWNPDYRYKMIGKLIKANGQFLIIFDLTAAEVYERIARDGKKPVRSRVPVFPKEWQTQFGLPVEEHRKSLKVNFYNGYAVFGIKDAAGEDSTDSVHDSGLDSETAHHDKEV